MERYYSRQPEIGDVRETERTAKWKTERREFQQTKGGG